MQEAKSAAPLAGRIREAAESDHFTTIGRFRKRREMEKLKDERPIDEAQGRRTDEEENERAANNKHSLDDSAQESNRNNRGSRKKTNARTRRRCRKNL